MTFASTAVQDTGGATFELDGDLTIRDVTRPMTLRGEYLGTESNPYGKTVLAAAAKTTLEREDWNVSWNMVLETGGFPVRRRSTSRSRSRRSRPASRSDHGGVGRVPTPPPRRR